MDLKSISDEELVRNIKAIGEHKVHSEIYNRYVRKIYFKCISMVKDESLANDLTHDIFIKIFTKLYSYKGKSDLSFWINKISINHILHHFRIEKRKNLFDANQDITDFSETEFDPDHLDNILLNLKLDHLEIALNELPESDRMLLIMKYLNGMKVSEMSIQLNMKESAIKMRLARLRKRLMKIIELKLKDHAEK